MQFERRRAPRVRLNMEVSWHYGEESYKGTISDISVTGCFVLCSGDVVDGNPVQVEFHLASSKIITLRGHVVSHHEEIGFAMKFTELGKKETAFLKKLIDRAQSQISVS